MDELGEDRIIASTEEDPDSVWDNARGGYCVRRRVPLPYTIQFDGRCAVLLFDYREQRYRIMHCQLDSAEANLRSMVVLLEAKAEFVHQGFMDWTAAFQPFLFMQPSLGAAPVETPSKIEWWRILRLPPDATADEVKEAWKRQSKRHHPDKGGDAEAFKESVLLSRLNFERVG